MLSPTNFAFAFDMGRGLTEGVMLTKRLSKLCHTVVAKMPHRYLRAGEPTITL